MAPYSCDRCGAEFDTPSEYRRHMKTSHPEQAPSAADLEHAISGAEFPAPPGKLAELARERDEHEIARILDDLPEKDYRDAADVSRSFGELRAREEKPNHQPSVRGGEAAMESDAISAARLASLFEGIDFPSGLDDLKAHAASEAGEREMKYISNLPDRTYEDMSDVAKAFGEVKNDDGR